MSFQVLRPSPMRDCSRRARLQPPRLLLRAHFQPVFEQDDAGVDHQPFEQRYRLQEGARLVLGAEAHHALDAGAVVPAAVEDDDLARRRQVRDVALAVHLGLLAVGGRRQRDDAKHSRAHAFGDGLDGAALAGAVATLEDDADLEALLHHPLPQRHQIDVQLLQFALVGLVRELLVLGGGFGGFATGSGSARARLLHPAFDGVLPSGLLCTLPCHVQLRCLVPSMDLPRG